MSAKRENMLGSYEEACGDVANGLLYVVRPALCSEDERREQHLRSRLLLITYDGADLVILRYTNDEG
jgi:hypothetical protein